MTESDLHLLIWDLCCNNQVLIQTLSKYEISCLQDDAVRRARELGLIEKEK